MLRIGMLTPSSNTVLEPLTSAMVARLGDVTAHFSRFTVTEIGLSDKALGQFDMSPMLSAAELLSHAKVDVISWNGTSASWLGLDSDRALVAEIEARTATPASTCVLSMMDALNEMGASTYGLVTPYTKDVQDKIVDNLGAYGLRCLDEAHFGISDNFSFGIVDTDTIAGAIRKVARGGPDAILIMCTNLAGAPVAQALEEETGVPILDSVTVTVWGALRAAGRATDGLAPWGPALARLQAMPASDI